MDKDFSAAVIAMASHPVAMKGSGFKVNETQREVCFDHDVTAYLSDAKHPGPRWWYTFAPPHAFTRHATAAEAFDWCASAIDKKAAAA